jgi:hypothetical protein
MEIAFPLPYVQPAIEYMSRESYQALTDKLFGKEVKGKPRSKIVQGGREIAL